MKKWTILLIAALTTIMVIAGVYFSQNFNIIQKSDLSKNALKIDDKASDKNSNNQFAIEDTKDKGLTKVTDDGTQDKKAGFLDPVIGTAINTEDGEIQAFSSIEAKIIIYNTHPFEKFTDGVKITDMARNLEEILNQNGISTKFIYNPNTKLENSYNISRKLITDNVKNYKNSVLVDMHTGEIGQTDNFDIVINIGRGNKDYARNIEYANKILKALNEQNTGLKCGIEEYEWVWNQDLSNNAVMIVINDRF